MNTAIPTPFDIVSPPAGPLIPPSLAWFALASVLLFGFVVIQLSNRRRSSQSPIKTINSLVDDLKKESIKSADIISLERCARITRRILSVYAAVDTSGLSSEEMRALALQMEQSQKEEEKSAAKIAPLLANLEELAYSPPQHSGLRDEARSTVEAVVAALESHVRRFRPR